MSKLNDAQKLYLKIHLTKKVTGEKYKEIQEEIITRMACRASVKAGDTVSIPHLQKMLAELSQCHLPYHCPHGRAIFITMPVSELDKKFQRK